MDRQRHILFLILATAIFVTWSIVFKPPPRQPVKKDAEKAAAKTSETKDQAKTEKAAPGTAPAKPTPTRPEPPRRSDLVLGKKDDPAWHIFAQFTNQGAAVTRLQLNGYKDESRQHAFVLLREETPGFHSFVLTVDKEDREGLATRNWEVVSSSENQIIFRTRALDDRIEIEKKFTLAADQDTVNLSVSLKNVSSKPIEEVQYLLTGGNGIPIEGAWYTRYFRNFTAVQVAPRGYASLVEESSATIADNAAKGKPPTLYRETPIQFAGVASQYFASLVIQSPAAQEERLIAVAEGVDLDREWAEREKLTGKLTKAPNFQNITARLTSEPAQLAPGKGVEHSYLLFNGPKKEAVLEQYRQYELPMIIHYSDFIFIPIGWIARVMVVILNFFYGIVGDYGISIILLTILVRSCMFPVSFRQAKAMQRMQVVQPKIEELRKKYANDKEKLGRAQMDLYKKEGVNPLAGCLPLVLQLPVFVGLYQSLSQSFSLRQSSFLWGYTWIKDLSAPDQLFPFGIDLPKLGPYFNLLPVISVAQMMLQMIYMSPPATTPEAAMQKKMMMFMMVFFGAMFYQVPAGLCVYMITSGAWSMIERQFLPKNPPAVARPVDPVASEGSGGNGVSWKSPVEKKKGRARRG